MTRPKLPQQFALPALLLAGVTSLYLAGCDPFSEDQSVSQGFAGSLEQNFADVRKAEGRVECRPAGKDYWGCRVESDPGSGWSGEWHLKVGKDGCWRGRPVGHPRVIHQTDPRSDLSFGGVEAFGRTLEGCADD